MKLLALLFLPLMTACSLLRPVVPSSTDPDEALRRSLDFAGMTISALSRAADKDQESDYRERLRACPTEKEPREACKESAQQASRKATAQRVEALRVAAAVQNEAAELLDAALACRRQAADCESVKRKQASDAVNELAGALGELSRH